MAHVKHRFQMREGYTRRKVTPREWNDVHISESGLPLSPVQSIPPTGKCPVLNLYVNPSNGRLVVEYDDGG